ncbi:MAG: mechanosensitive ion channel family protein [Chloroflexota bacterium]|nr:mechanosensitive ion channel family protein [Chloroflexota bacterium]
MPDADEVVTTATDPQLYQELALVIGIIIISAVAGRLLLFVLSNTVFRLARRATNRVDEIVLHAIRGPIIWGVTLLGIGIAYEAQRILLPDDWDVPMEHFLFIGYAVIAYILLHRLITNLLDWYIHKEAGANEPMLDKELLPFLHRLLTIILLTSTIVLILQDLGKPVGSLIATLGIGSLAVALAAQSTLSDIIAGILILVDRRYRVGDRIELLNDGIIGDVQEIGLRTTHILTLDYRMVIVPNSMIANNMVVNHAYPDGNLRVDLPIGVAYGEDIRHVKAVLLAAIRRIEGVQQVRHPDVVLTDFADSAVNLEMRVWINAFADKPKMIDRINEAAYTALNAAGIEIPFPQRTLWHRVEREAVPALRTVLDGRSSKAETANGDAASDERELERENA